MIDWSHPHVRSRVAVVVAFALVLTACGGGADDTGGTNEPAVTQTPGAPNAPSAPAGGGDEVPDAVEPQTFDINQDFFHSGFRVEIVSGELSFEENALSGEVRNFLTITATLENLGADEAFFGPNVVVTTANNSYTPGFGSDIPDVPGGLKSQATIGYAIDADFDLASAQLVVGSADENRAVVPLSGGGDAVRLEPSEVDVSGTLSMELIDLVFSSGDLRYDIVSRHRQVDAGKQALTLNFDVVSRKGGNWNLFPTDFALILPDGTPIAADDADTYRLAGSDEGITTADRWMRFIIDEMPSGTFAVRLAPGTWFIGEDGVTEATFEFPLP
jgi:hypothetical protein